MAVPLLAKDGLLGAMAVWRGTADPAFSQAELDFLVGLARQAAIAIENARLFSEIQRQKDYAGALVENSPVAIVTTDLDANVVSWNPGAEKLFGYHPQDAIGRSLDELIARDAALRAESQAINMQTMQGRLNPQRAPPRADPLRRRRARLRVIRSRSSWPRASSSCIRRCRSRATSSTTRTSRTSAPCSSRRCCASAVPVTLVDAFALPGAGLRWRDDGRAQLGCRGRGGARRVCGPRSTSWSSRITPVPPPAAARRSARGRAGRAARRRAARARSCSPTSTSRASTTSRRRPRRSSPPTPRWTPGSRTRPRSRSRRSSASRAGRAVRLRRRATAGPRRAAAARVGPRRSRRTRRVHAAASSRASIGAWAFPIDGRTLPIVTSRGCPFALRPLQQRTPIGASAQPKTQRRLLAARLREHLRGARPAHGATRVHVARRAGQRAPAPLRHACSTRSRPRTSGSRSRTACAPTTSRRAHLRPPARSRHHAVSVSAESGSQRVLDEVVGKQLDLARHRSRRPSTRTGSACPCCALDDRPARRDARTRSTRPWPAPSTLWDRYGACPAVQFATPLPGTRLAEGVRLPLVDDWGPHFQTRAVAAGPSAAAAELRRFKHTFDARLRASLGPEKLDHERHLRVQQPLHLLCGRHAHAGRRPPRAAARAAANYRRRGVELVDFDGGEPTLNPDLVALVRYARALGYERINVTTNGRLCAYPEFADAARTLRAHLPALLACTAPDARTHAAAGRASPRRSSRRCAGIRNCVAAAPAGRRARDEHHPHQGQPPPAPRHRRARASTLGLRWLNIQFLTPFGRATRDGRARHRRGRRDRDGGHRRARATA